MLDRIRQLKIEKDAVVLAHYYVGEDIQAIADYVGDSFYLCKVASTVPQTTIVLCGVSFMGESAKLLNPEKNVILPELDADCPMAHMVDPQSILELRQRYQDLAVVCYINSSAEIKRHSDVCVTSSNALKVIQSLPNENIYFIPDENLGRYIASKVPEKDFHFCKGFCHVHVNITSRDVIEAKKAHPEALVLAHPECTPDVLNLADYIGSTSGIIDYSTSSPENSFIICTESGVLFELRNKNPNKQFYLATSRQICPDMKKITLEKVVQSLEDGSPTVFLDQDLMRDAVLPLGRMMTIGI